MGTYRENLEELVQDLRDLVGLHAGTVDMEVLRLDTNVVLVACQKGVPDGVYDSRLPAVVTPNQRGHAAAQHEFQFVVVVAELTEVAHGKTS